MDNCPKKDCYEPNALIFRKIVIPASVADDRVNPPKNGEYCNQLVVYEASGNAYLFSSDGIPTLISSSTAELEAAIKEETTERKEEDEKLWDEIEMIEASSDVVDVVGTYAELQAYDTSKLKDNDLIKVLADETRDDAITYYRWSTSTEAFTYVGSEGPYYTEGQVDTLLSAKQDNLIAGTNIQIASDGKTISATDTTYNAFTGATASIAGTSGLVPAPSAGDNNKVLKGDGTWGEGAANTIFYRNSSETGATRHIYKNANMTGFASMQDLLDANEKGQVILRLSTASHPEDFSDAYLQNAYVGTNDYQMLFLDEKAYTSFDTTQPTDTAFYYSRRELQDKLTAGTNVQINGTTISATDTTYSAFTGATSQAAGAAGLVPAPAIGDDTKYLKGDGTWATVSSGSNNVAVFYAYVAVGQNGHIYSDQAMTTMITTDDFQAAIDDPNTIVVIYDPDGDYQHVVLSGEGTTAYILDSHGSSIYKIYDNSVAPDDTTFAMVATEYQPKLTAGSNISIGTVSGTPNTISVTGMPVLYGSQGQNTDGAVTQKFFTDTVGNIETILQTLNSGAGVP